MLRKLTVAAVLLVAVALVTGCAPQITRTADPSEGDFYTGEEYQKLKKDQREAYCADLLGAYGEASGLRGRARPPTSRREKAAIGDLEDAIAGSTPELMRLRSEVDGSPESRSPTSRVFLGCTTVEKGDFLSKIAGMEEIYADPLKWKRIYRANKDVIDGFSDPNLIYPDWNLTIPRDWPRSYTVKAGENLWMIAKRWEIYGDGRMWTRIYEANRDQLQRSEHDQARPDSDHAALERAVIGLTQARLSGRDPRRVWRTDRESLTAAVFLHTTSGSWFLGSQTNQEPVFWE